MAVATRDVETQQPAPYLETWRCRSCNRILAKVRLGPGSHIEIKCSSCNRYAERSKEYASRSVI